MLVSTIVLGISNAQFLPVSREAIEAHQVKSVAAALVVILLLGWLVTIGLHRHPLRIWKALSKQAGGPPPDQAKPSN